MTDGRRVPAAQLRGLIRSLFSAAGTSDADAQLLARLLVEQDMVQGGRMSHGSWAAARRIAHNDYVRRMIPGDRRTPDQQGLQLPGDGRVNPRPDVRVVRETPTTRVLDGDGGLGHIVCMQATDWAIETAKRFGTAAATCCNHFHVGAVGFCERTEPPGPAACAPSLT